jgi:3-deoxy-D-manno-octulosonic-acid transferase
MAHGYDALMTCLALPLAGGAWVSARWRRELAERLGRYPPELAQGLGGRPAIWLHAASVGELQGLRAILGPLRDRFPGHACVVSTLTATGRTLARDLPGVDGAFLFPWDARWIVRRALAMVGPDLFLFTETEIWPGFLSMCAARNIPCVLVSGRLSADSVRWYSWARPLMRRALARVTFCMQSEDDARRLTALGVDPERVNVSGNLKVEAPLDARVGARVAAVLGRAGVSDRALVIGASTHRGEEAALLQAFARLRARAGGMFLLLAPRHPERFAEVANLLDRDGGDWARFSELERDGQTTARHARVILLDCMGILRSCFPFACLVFVGGTLAPVGGHNVLEPAAEGCAVVLGPHTEHVAEMVRLLVAAGGAHQVADAEDLGRVVAWLGADAEAARGTGARAAEVAAAQRGAVERHLRVITSIVNPAAARRAHSAE